jgi:hypothetical protein
MAAVDIDGAASPRSRAGSFVVLVALVALAAGLLTAVWLARPHPHGRAPVLTSTARR